MWALPTRHTAKTGNRAVWPVSVPEHVSRNTTEMGSLSVALGCAKLVTWPNFIGALNRTRLVGLTTSPRHSQAHHGGNVYVLNVTA